MKSPYIAKGPHKRPCDLCGVAILPGDLVEAWMWVAEEPCYSNIIRAHATCSEILRREGIEEWGPLGAAFADNPEVEAEAKEKVAASRLVVR